ncbi:MAG: alcohol dehydrogenase catalytic domain-containing protein [Bacteroidetes bacterium]|nr:alcohol dehydrogenase catalytic domain-containing protein [Bacteroidota bacterium]
MQALIFENELLLKDVPVPEPAAGEVLVKILYSSICNTDLEIIKGYMGFRGVLGHEFVGRVITESHPLRGKTVVGEINCSCGKCYLCLSSRRTHCTNRLVTGIDGHQGVFAGFISLPAENLHIVPDSIPGPVAVFTEPLAAAVEIFEQLHMKPSKPVFIFGAGKLGMLVSMVARLQGFDYTTFDLIPEKTVFARSLGLNAKSLKELLPGEKAEVCIDCTGNAEGIKLALKHLWPRGTLVLKTTVADTAKPDLNSIVINEFTILGSRCGLFKPALNLLERNLVDPSPLISGEFAFTDILKAFESAKNPLNHKIIINHQL